MLHKTEGWPRMLFGWPGPPDPSITDCNYEVGRKKKPSKREEYNPRMLLKCTYEGPLLPVGRVAATAAISICCSTRYLSIK